MLLLFGELAGKRCLMARFFIIFVVVLLPAFAVALLLLRIKRLAQLSFLQSRVVFNGA